MGEPNRFLKQSFSDTYSHGLLDVASEMSSKRFPIQLDYSFIAFIWNPNALYNKGK